MYPEDFGIILSDKNFLNEDGTLAITVNIARVSYIGDGFFIMYNFGGSIMSVDFLNNSGIVCRFSMSDSKKEYFVKNHTKNQRFEVSNRESFYSTLSESHPGFKNWLIWNHL